MMPHLRSSTRKWIDIAMLVILLILNFLVLYMRFGV